MCLICAFRAHLPKYLSERKLSGTIFLGRCIGGAVRFSVKFGVIKKSRAKETQLQQMHTFPGLCGVARICRSTLKYTQYTYNLS
jgi:hypothetical protein